MNHTTVTARETFTYDGLTRRAGESFTASAEDARILIMIGRAARADDHKHDAPQSDSDEAPEPRRRSRRKDIVPEP